MHFFKINNAHAFCILFFLLLILFFSTLIRHISEWMLGPAGPCARANLGLRPMAGRFLPPPGRAYPKFGVVVGVAWCRINFVNLKFGSCMCNINPAYCSFNVGPIRAVRPGLIRSDGAVGALQHPPREPTYPGRCYFVWLGLPGAAVGAHGHFVRVYDIPTSARHMAGPGLV